MKTQLRGSRIGRRFMAAALALAGLLTLQGCRNEPSDAPAQPQPGSGAAERFVLSTRRLDPFDTRFIKEAEPDGELMLCELPDLPIEDPDANLLVLGSNGTVVELLLHEGDTYDCPFGGPFRNPITVTGVTESEITVDLDCSLWPLSAKGTLSLSGTYRGLTIPKNKGRALALQAMDGGLACYLFYPDAAELAAQDAPPVLRSGELPDADAAQVVAESGALGADCYAPLLRSGVTILGADAEKRILFVDSDFSLRRAARDGTEDLLCEALIGRPGSTPEDVAWDGGRYVAWSESPHAEDGAGWAVYLLDLLTGETRLIDEDRGSRPRDDVLFPYLAPTRVRIADGCVAYLAFTDNMIFYPPVTQTVMLYDIAAEEASPIYPFRGDPKTHGLEGPTVGGGCVAWSEVYEREDGSRESRLVMYSLAEKKVWAPSVTESLASACLTDGWLVCEAGSGGQLAALEIPSDAPRYLLDTESRGAPSVWGRYAVWTGGEPSELRVLELKTGRLCRIRAGAGSISGARLLPGGLLLWQEQRPGTAGEPETGWAFLIEHPRFADVLLPNTDRINAQDIRQEHLFYMEEWERRFRAFLSQNRAALDRLTAEMLRLEALRSRDEGPEGASLWYRPSEGLRSVPAAAARQDADALRDALDALAVSGLFSDAGTDTSRRIVDGNICSFAKNLIDNAPSWFAAVSLNYSETPRAAAQPYFTVEWIDEHWFYYIEWHE